MQICCPADLSGVQAGMTSRRYCSNVYLSRHTCREAGIQRPRMAALKLSIDAQILGL